MNSLERFHELFTSEAVKSSNQKRKSAEKDIISICLSQILFDFAGANKADITRKQHA